MGDLPRLAPLTALVLRLPPVHCQQGLGYLFLHSFCWPDRALVQCLEQGRAEKPTAIWLCVCSLNACTWQLTQGSAGVMQEVLQGRAVPLEEPGRRKARGALFSQRGTQLPPCSRCLKLCCSPGTFPVLRAPAGA